MTQKPISDAAKRAANQLLDLYSILDDAGIHAAPIIQSAIDEATEANAFDLSPAMVQARNDQLNAQLEQWKACAEKYALMLNRICPDIHTFNSGVSPREIRGLVEIFNQLKGQ